MKWLTLILMALVISCGIISYNLDSPKIVVTYSPIEVSPPPQKITIEIQRIIYINIEETPDEEPEVLPTPYNNNSFDYKEIILPNTSGFKSYMSYKSLTKKSSQQYKLQQKCETDNNGFRIYNGRYVIAVGTGVGGHIGDEIDLVLENGCVIPCVIGDYKAPSHTDETNLISKNNCCSEFIVDISSLQKTVKKRGDVSFLRPEWKSKVVTIRRKI